MGMEFDKEPVWTRRDCDRGFFPKIKAAQAGSVSAGKRGIVEASNAATGAAVKVEHPRALHDKRKHSDGPAGLQVSAVTVRRRLMQRQLAFVERIQFGDLGGMKNRRPIGHIHVASAIGEYLHFAVNAATISVDAIRQGEVSVYESVFRCRDPFFIRQTPMLVG